MLFISRPFQIRSDSEDHSIAIVRNQEAAFLIRGVHVADK